MKILIFGADGFVGSAVAKELSDKHEVYKAVRNKSVGITEVDADLTKKDSVLRAIKNVRPDAVINCAGIVENTEKAMLNAVFTLNLLESIKDSEQDIKKIIVCGSASEYGVRDQIGRAIHENANLNASSLYGESKIKESTLALKFGEKNNLPVVVVMIFNPIGLGMNPRLLLPNILPLILFTQLPYEIHLDV